MDNPEDNYQFEFHAKAPANDENHFWFKVGDILELESVWNYAQEHGLKSNERDAFNLLEKLKDAFHTKQLISFFEEKEKNLNKVLNIFIRVNSDGVKLSYSDLLMSILTASFSSDIREKMNELVDALKDKGFPNVEQDQVLKTCLLLIGKDTTFELKNFNKNNIKEIEENWKKITESIYNAAKLLKTFGYAGHNLNYKTTTFQIDHIYPKSKFKKGNEKLDKDFYECRNHLYNLQLLEGQENSTKKDKDPEVWLKEEYKNEQAIEEYKRRNYIDPTLKLEWENIKEFRKKREETIIKRLKEELLPQS